MIMGQDTPVLKISYVCLRNTTPSGLFQELNKPALQKVALTGQKVSSPTSCSENFPENTNIL
jgi:hypothetical protein